MTKLMNVDEAKGVCLNRSIRSNAPIQIVYHWDWQKFIPVRRETGVNVCMIFYAAEDNSSLYRK